MPTMRKLMIVPTMLVIFALEILGLTAGVAFLTTPLVISLATPASAADFRLAYKGDLKSLDPYSLNEIFTLGMLGNVYEGLTKRGPNLEIQPSLAESWETPEPTRWRIHLRRNVKFQTGEDFTADDVVFSAERVRATGSDLKNAVPADAKVIKIDDHTVDFVLSSPNPILMAEWDTWYIMSKKWAQANAAIAPQPASGGQVSYAAMHADGTGPFVVASHAPGVKTEFEPNQKWWGERKNNFDKVVFTTIANDSTRVAALLSGDVDFIDPVPMQDIERVRSAGVSVMTGPEVRTMFLGFDQSRDELGHSDVKGRNPFKDVRVREAFAKAVDVETIKTKIMRGNSVVASTLISPLLFEPTTKIKRWAFDPDGAKRLLAEAGYPNGFTVQMDCTNDRYINDSAICMAVSSMLARVGIKIDLNIQPKAKFFAAVTATGGYDTSFYLLGWTPTSLDGANVINNIVGCRDGHGRGSYNLGGYCRPEIETLNKRILVETDPIKRRQLMSQAFGILHDDVATVPLHQQTLAWGVAKGVKVDQRPDNQIRFYLFSKKTETAGR